MRKFLSRHHNKIGLTILGVLFLTQSVGATPGGVTLLPGQGAVPEWAVYVGLMAICPKDVNEYMRNRMGLTDDSETSEGT